ncbi:hypothetical protein CDAR_400391 [Caerostris darwini]|uniref:Uncharacterized protein n=1 Tax=Caerostris darwini TaxID=1538125 RepID=A0AAV4TRA1_9ARAC|nr:hypothetical protein CDAR_400391 [Caerostris darwini]
MRNPQYRPSESSIYKRFTDVKHEGWMWGGGGYVFEQRHSECCFCSHSVIFVLSPTDPPRTTESEKTMFLKGVCCANLWSVEMSSCNPLLHPCAPSPLPYSD